MTYRKFIIALFAVLLFGAAQPALAQAAPELTAGEVTKIDESAQKITIRHGPIKKFEMEDGMTMVFRAKEPEMLKKVKPGDKVKFEADRVNGQFTVMSIEKTK
jgi:Cu/Ag efflux protein CusF